MNALLLLVIAAWAVINGYVVYKGFVFLRQVNRYEPDLDETRLASWIREKELPEDVPEDLLPALTDLRQWRAIGRRYFIASVVVILGLVALEALHQG